MALHHHDIIIDPNLTSFPAASLHRALEACDSATRRRLAHPEGAADRQAVVTIARAQILAYDGTEITITAEQLDNPPTGITTMLRPAQTITLDIIRRNPDAGEHPVPVQADMLMCGWPGNEVIIPKAGCWQSDDTDTLADIIQDAAIRYADGALFWQADSPDYARRAKLIAQMLLADRYRSFIDHLEQATALLALLPAAPKHPITAFHIQHAVTWHPARTWDWLDTVIHEVTGSDIHSSKSLEAYTTAAQRLMREQHSETVYEAVRQVHREEQNRRRWDRDEG